MKEPLDPPSFRETRDEEIENRLRALEQTTRWMRGLRFVQRLRALVEDDPDVTPEARELCERAIEVEESKR